MDEIKYVNVETTNGKCTGHTTYWYSYCIDVVSTFWYVGCQVHDVLVHYKMEMDSIYIMELIT